MKIKIFTDVFIFFTHNKGKERFSLSAFSFWDFSAEWKSHSADLLLHLQRLYIISSALALWVVLFTASSLVRLKPTSLFSIFQTKPNPQFGYCLCCLARVTSVDLSSLFEIIFFPLIWGKNFLLPFFLKLDM